MIRKHMVLIKGVVYFDQQIGALKTVHWAKSCFLVVFDNFKLFIEILGKNRQKDKIFLRSQPAFGCKPVFESST